MKFIALMPMRHYSSRIKGKNYKKLNNKILFFYLADTLFNSKLFKNLIINTDSDKISQLAKKRYGDWVIINYRLKKLHGENISTNMIIEQDLKIFKDKYFYFQTHSTNPFLKIKTIKDSIKKFKSQNFQNKFDSLMSVNLLKTRLYNHNYKPINHDINKLIRTQDLKPIYEENSNFYIFSYESFKYKKSRIGKKYSFYVMNDNRESLDIDEKKQWDMALEIVKK